MKGDLAEQVKEALKNNKDAKKLGEKDELLAKVKAALKS